MFNRIRCHLRHVLFPTPADDIDVSELLPAGSLRLEGNDVVDTEEEWAEFCEKTVRDLEHDRAAVNAGRMSPLEFVERW